MNMYEFSNLNLEETAAAQLTLLGKRERVYSPDDSTWGCAKKSRDDDVNGRSAFDVEASAKAGQCRLTNNRGQPKPYPYFYYTDYSMSPDPDPLIPLTPPGRYVKDSIWKPQCLHSLDPLTFFFPIPHQEFLILFPKCTPSCLVRI
jgi:hypothetical protein